jgi:dolichol-phosphate mannosyltransferase
MSQPINPKPIDIIIPVYNEGEVIVQTLDEISGNLFVDYNILIIYDFDKDNTIPVVISYVVANKIDNVFLVKNAYSRGVLNAIKTGFESAISEAVLVVMGDASDDLAVVNQMYHKLQEGNDIICGSRYMKGGRQIGGPVLKKFLSRMAGTSLHFLTGIPSHDVSNSFKLYRKSVVDNLVIESTGGFEIGMEILIKAFIDGKKIAEVPSTWRDRTGGKSKFKLAKWLPHYLHWYFHAIKYSWFHKKR